MYRKLDEQMRLANLMQTPSNPLQQKSPWMRLAGGEMKQNPMGGVLGMLLQKVMGQHYQNNPPQPWGIPGMGQPVGQPGSMDQDMYPWYMDPGEVRDVY